MNNKGLLFVQKLTKKKLNTLFYQQNKRDGDEV